MGSNAEGRCVDANVFAAHLAGTLSSEEARAVEEHFDRCPTCRKEFSALASTEGGSTGSERLPWLAVGSRVGRYVITSLIGQGGMGIVYRAHDPQLGRAIALKMMRGEVSDRQKARLMVEAQAMARLSHPNVVAIHDLIVEDGHLFIAMELIEGTSLGKWLAGERPRADVMRVFRDAGRGLAAAHAVGIVHGDFKPENVLVDEARHRVCVTDFGLARFESTEAASSSAASSTSFDSMLAGTPAYMAPEQFRHERVVPATDQFSFCVALYEALYGSWPFQGTTIESRAAALARDSIPPAPPDKGVSTAVGDALLRGLARSPEDRFPSMAALLDALASESAKTRSRHAAALSLALFAALLVAWLGHHWMVAVRGAAAPTAQERLAGAWDVERKSASEAAFLATNKSYAEDTWRAAERNLDEYVQSWSALYTELAKVKAPGADVLRKRACVEDRLAEIGALSDVFAHADSAVLGHAIEATQALVPVAQCTDLKSAAIRPPLPADPETARKVVEIRHRLAEVRLARAAGASKRGIALADQAVNDARSLGYRPLEAQAVLEYGEVMALTKSHATGEALLREAVSIAESVGDDRSKARALLSLYGTFRWEEKPELVAMARDQSIAAVARLGDDQELQESLEIGLGSEELQAGRWPEAGQYFEKAVAIAEKIHGTSSVKYGTYNVLLALALSQMGDHQRALPLQQRALAILNVAGHETPAVSVARMGVSIELLELLRAQDAEAELRRVVPFYESEFGPEVAAFPRDLLGWALSEQGRYSEALTLHQRSLDAYDQLGKPDFTDRVDSALGMGRAHLGLRQPALAIPFLERARAIVAPSKKASQAEATVLLAEALATTKGGTKRALALAASACLALEATGKGPRHDRDLARAEAVLQKRP